MTSKPKDYDIAYFSMEIALHNAVKTYSGGLGVLAGDTLRSAADLKVPMVGVTLLNDQGYFKQKISAEGKQEVLPVHYDFKKLKKLNHTVEITINKDIVKVGVWLYEIKGIDGFIVPVYLLDTKIKGNVPIYASLTGQLYRSGLAYRLMQEIVLGRAGVKMIQKLGYNNLHKYHMNEGHAAFVAIELLKQSRQTTFVKKLQEVKSKCVFTTHTPVKAGHDIFNKSLVKEYQPDFPFQIKQLYDKNKQINMTLIGLYLSKHVNGVAMKHKEVTLQMFPQYDIIAITNGIHSSTWVSPPMHRLFDRYLPNWKKSSFALRNTFRIPRKYIWAAHQESKQQLLKYIDKHYDIKLKPNVFTIGFARRFATYKRAWLLLSDMERILKIHKKYPIQIVFSGKAHPSDEAGKNVIAEIIALKEKYKNRIKIVFIEGYDMKRAKLLVGGVDVWLNTPLPPFEASGTSGMKAAHNGVPHFSTLDGWWIEGHIENRTGWSIGHKGKKRSQKESIANKHDAADMYDKLENVILPLYYKNKDNWKHVMRNSIAINASFFNTHRMLQQYVQEAYLVD